jgi:hypothetical protein
MDALSAADQPPVTALGRGSVGQTREPLQRYRYCAPVDQLYRESDVRYLYPSGFGRVQFNR